MSNLLDSLGTTPPLARLFSGPSVLAAMLEFESGLARAQAHLGMIPLSAATAITKSCTPDAFDIDTMACEARQSASLAIPLVNALTASVATIDPSAAQFVHWGTTSQDVIDSALMLLLHRALPLLEADHARLAAKLPALSEEHANSVMIARTLLQSAVPITFGYKVALWYAPIARSWRRLSAAFHDAVCLQFGGAAGTLAAYGELGPALARELARELGLPPSDAPWHTGRDRLAAFVAACGIYVAALGKMARDISLLMQAEVGEAAEPGGGSSAMPDKRNPSGCTIVLAATTRMPGLVAAYLTAMIQEHERAAGGWQSEWQTLPEVVETTGSALSAAAGVVEGLSVFPERMRANLAGRAPDIGAAEEFRRRIIETCH